MSTNPASHNSRNSKSASHEDVEQVSRTRFEIAPFERDLKVMQTCVSVAPLLGLLGTVTGMLATFAALATTGAAGPDPLLEPGRPPVAPGRVHVALALEGRPTQALALDLPGPRALVQRLAAVRALDLLRRSI